MTNLLPIPLTEKLKEAVEAEKLSKELKEKVDILKEELWENLKSRYTLV
ncbi:unnamed protein product, partial [marine sediment metagenome]